MKKNRLKESFLASLPKCTIETSSDKLKSNISFNFQYLDSSQCPPGIKMMNLNHEQIQKLNSKLVEYCKESIEHWKNQRIGKRASHVLEVYGKFPAHSDYHHPQYVPAEVAWARFRLEYDFRLVGFLIPEDYAEKYGLFRNIFYIVFIDPEHLFYKTEDR